MDKENSHINLGLTKEELELLIRNANNPDLLKQYEEKLDNCDLSKSAIELINQNSLAAVGRLSNSITSKYPTPKPGNYGKLIFAGILSVGILIGISTILNTGDNQTIEEAIQNKELKNPTSDAETLTNVENEKSDVEITKEEISDNNQGSTKTIKPVTTIPNQIVSNDSSEVSNEVQEKNTTEKKVTKEVEIEKAEDKREKVEFVAVKEKRQVRHIRTTESVANKYKDLDYRFTDLVSYSGGKEELERHLFEQLKDKVKDSDVPQRNSSIIFKFNVTYKGKVKDINVLSLVSPELKQKIEETTVNLTNWNKGKKRIPRDYTVYITFK